MNEAQQLGSSNSVIRLSLLVLHSLAALDSAFQGIHGRWFHVTTDMDIKYRNLIKEAGRDLDNAIKKAMKKDAIPSTGILVVASLQWFTYTVPLLLDHMAAFPGFLDVDGPAELKLQLTGLFVSI